MAVRFDAAADRLLRTTGLLDFNSPYTWMYWLYLTSDLNAISVLSILHNNSVNNQDGIRTGSDGTTIESRVSVGGVATSASGTNLALATWYHIAAVRESVSSFKLYINGVLDSTNTRDITGRTTPTRMEHGAFGSGNGSPYDGRVDRIKAWSAALTIEEVQAEMWSIRPQRTDSLYGFWPTWTGADRVTDYSGNGRDWTASGTLTDEDPAPVGWGAQNTRIYVPAAAAPSTIKYRRTLSALGTRIGSRQGI